MEIVEITDDNHILSFSGRELRSILAGPIGIVVSMVLHKKMRSLIKKEQEN